MCKKEYGFSKFDVDTLVEKIDPKKLANFYTQLEPMSTEEGKKEIKKQLTKIEEEKKKVKSLLRFTKMLRLYVSLACKGPRKGKRRTAC